MPKFRNRLAAAMEYVEMVRRRPLLLLEITSRCQLDCMYCYNVWKQPGGEAADDLPTETIWKIVQRALEGSGGRHVTFTGGEPLLRADLEELVGRLTAEGVTTTVITNGLALDERRARDLVQAGVGLFELPLLSADRQMHNSLTRTDSFDAALEAIANIRLAGGRVVGVFVATGRNLPHWEQTLSLAEAMGVQGMLLNRFNPGGEGLAWAEELRPTLEQLTDALAVADRAAAADRMAVGIPVPIPPCTVDPTAYPHLRFQGCQAGTANAYWTIDPQGNVRPCNHSQTILGNVLREPWRKITDKRRLASWVSPIPSRCHACRHVRRCRGGCRAAAEAAGGRPGDEDPFVRQACQERGELL